jgi:hypothetical protein
VATIAAIIRARIFEGFMLDSFAWVDERLPTASPATSATAEATSGTSAKTAAGAATAETTLAGFESGAVRGIKGVVPRFASPVIGRCLVACVGRLGRSAQVVARYWILSGDGARRGCNVARQRQIQRLPSRIAVHRRRGLLRRKRGRKTDCEGEENRMANRVGHD